jgi:hypothetical protein
MEENERIEEVRLNREKAEALVPRFQLLRVLNQGMLMAISNDGL